MKKLSKMVWFYTTILVAIALMLTAAIFVYVFDPFLYYRINPTDKVLKADFVTSGLARNGTFDTAIIGSSMVQNYRMDSFRKELGWNAVKLTTNGGMTVGEIDLVIGLVSQNDHYRRVVLNVDMTTYNFSGTPKITIPVYLYNSTMLDDYKYWWNYDVWTKFLPIDIGITVANNFHMPLPEKVRMRTSIEKIADWGADFTFKEAAVLENFRGSKFAVSSQDTHGMAERMTSNFYSKMDKWRSELRGREMLLILPPYSVLFWYDAQAKGYLSELMQFRKEIAAYSDLHPEVRVFDFQAIQEISDLDNYKDLTHYAPKINEQIIREISKNSNLLTAGNVIQRNRSILESLSLFSERARRLGLVEREQ